MYTNLGCQCVISEKTALFSEWALVMLPEIHCQLRRMRQASQRQIQARANSTCSRNRRRRPASFLKASLKVKDDWPVTSQTKRL